MGVFLQYPNVRSSSVDRFNKIIQKSPVIPREIQNQREMSPQVQKYSYQREQQQKRAKFLGIQKPKMSSLAVNFK